MWPKGPESRPPILGETVPCASMLQFQQTNRTGDSQVRLNCADLFPLQIPLATVLIIRPAPHAHMVLLAWRRPGVGKVLSHACRMKTQYFCQGVPEAATLMATVALCFSPTWQPVPLQFTQPGRFNSKVGRGMTCGWLSVILNKRLDMGTKARCCKLGLLLSNLFFRGSQRYNTK